MGSGSFIQYPESGLCGVSREQTVALGAAHSAALVVGPNLLSFKSDLKQTHKSVDMQQMMEKPDEEPEAGH